MDIESKLNDIKNPPVMPLGEGQFSSFVELWDKFIKPRLPRREIVLEWHRVLMEYIQQPDAVFPVRGYNSAPKKEQYGELRRGFLTRTNDNYCFF